MICARIRVTLGKSALVCVFEVYEPELQHLQ
jgi:hypothetical protein